MVVGPCQPERHLLVQVLVRDALIAIVDDDEAMREALCDLLLVLDFACRSFDRAEAFMAEFESARFDCLITDVSMPGRSGLELQERLAGTGLVNAGHRHHAQTQVPLRESAR